MKKPKTGMVLDDLPEGGNIEDRRNEPELTEKEIEWEQEHYRPHHPPLPYEESTMANDLGIEDIIKILRTPHVTLMAVMLKK